ISPSRSPVLYGRADPGRLVATVSGSTYDREQSVVLEVALGTPETTCLGRVGQLQAAFCHTPANDDRVVYVFLLNEVTMNQFRKMIAMMGVMGYCLLACQSGKQTAPETGFVDGVA